MINIPKSKFLRVKCNECEQSQIIFGSASRTITCIKCDRVLAKPTSGKTEIKTHIIEVLE